MIARWWLCILTTTPVAVHAAASWSGPMPKARRLCNADSLRLQHRPRLGLQAAGWHGKLKFGAAHGPASWVERRDGKWSAGYWVELEEAPGFVLVSLSDIAPGLKAGDACLLLSEGRSPRCIAFSEDATLKDGTAIGASEYQAGCAAVWCERLASQLVQPLALLALTMTLGLTFAQLAPSPDKRLSLERCERLVTGAVEMADRRAAEAWISACDDAIRGAEAEELLNDLWLRRWGELEAKVEAATAEAATAEAATAWAATAQQAAAQAPAADVVAKARPRPQPPRGMLVAQAAASEPPVDGDASDSRASLAALAAALEDLEAAVADTPSCEEARAQLRAPLFDSFLGYRADDGKHTSAPPSASRSALVAAIPEERRAQAALEVAAMLDDLRGMDVACSASVGVGVAPAAGRHAHEEASLLAMQRLERARDRLRQVIALYYGEQTCVGSPCNGQVGLPSR